MFKKNLKKEKGHTEIVFLIDRSGSMRNIAKDMEGGFRTFINNEIQTKDKTKVTQIRFDDLYEIDYIAKDIADVPDLKIQPRGTTALLDSLGDAITATRKRYVKTAKAKRPARVVFVTITDGEENASRRFKKNQIADLVKQQREDYNWDFVFMGANIDSFKEGRSIGVAAASTMNYTADTKGVTSSWEGFTRGYGDYKMKKSLDKNHVFSFVSK